MTARLPFPTAARLLCSMTILGVFTVAVAGDDAIVLIGGVGPFTADLAPGSTVRFRFVSRTAGPHTIRVDSFDFDAALAIERTSGERLEDDDGGVATNARLSVDLEAMEEVSVEVTGRGSGTYSLTVVPESAPIPTGRDAALAEAAYYGKVADRRRSRDDLEGAIDASIAAGLALHKWHAPEAELEAFERARRWADELGDPALSDQGLALELRALNDAKRFDDAILRGEVHQEAGEKAAADSRDPPLLLLVELARAHVSRGDAAPAEALLNDVLDRARVEGDTAAESAALEQLSAFHSAAGRADEAMACLDDWRAIAAREQDGATLGVVLVRIGVLAKKSADWATAVESLTAASAIFEEAGAIRNVAEIEDLLSACRRLSGANEVAVAHKERAIALYLECGLDEFAGRASVELAGIYGLLGQFDVAIEWLTRGADIARDHDNPVDEARARLRLGQFRLMQGDVETGVVDIEQALEAARKTGHPGLVGDCLIGLATYYRFSEQYGRCRDVLEQALAVADQSHSVFQAVLVRNFLIDLSFVLGDYHGALQHIDANLALGPAAGAAMILTNEVQRATASYHLGIYDDAYRGYSRALARARDDASRSPEIDCLTGLGEVCAAVGELDDAREHLQAALDVLRESQPPQTWVRAMNALALVLSRLERFDEARDLLDEAIGYADHAFGVDSTMHLLLTRCEVELHAERPEAALAIARNVEERSRQSENPVPLLRSLVIGGDCLANLGDADQALRYADEAAAIAAELGDDSTSLAAAMQRSRASLALGDIETAERVLTDAEVGLEAYVAQGWMGIEQAAEVRARFADLMSIRQELIARHLDQADPEDRAAVIDDGFRRAGAWKGRSLLEGMVEHRSGGRSREVTELIKRQRSELTQRMGTLHRVAETLRAGGSPDEVRALRARADEHLENAGRIAAELRAVAPRPTTAAAPPDVGIDAMRRDVCGPGRAVIDFVDGTEHLYAYVVGTERFDMVKLGALRDVRRSVDELTRAISDADFLAPPPQIAAIGGAAYAEVLAPALAALADDIEEIVIIPSTSLASLSFDALVVHAESPARTFRDLQFVIDQYRVSYAPSAAVAHLMATASDGDGEKLLLLAAPEYGGEAAPIEGSLEEARAIERIAADHDIPVDLMVGADADRKPLRSDLRDYRILHFATHGLASPISPRESGVLLAGDDGADLLSAEEVATLDLDADLVVLSACATAAGRVRAGTDVESLARAFLFAGARSVVATLWDVTDRAATEVMIEFYQRLLHDGLPPDEALRRARLSARTIAGDTASRGVGAPTTRREHQPRVAYDHPFFWASFVPILVPRR